MKKTMKMNLWFLKKLYQYDKKRFGSMAALILIRAIKTLLSVITIKVALDCIVTYHSFWYLAGFVAAERIVSSLLALIECKIDWLDKEIQNNTIKKQLGAEMFRQAEALSLDGLTIQRCMTSTRLCWRKSEAGSGSFLQSTENY